jgi:DNA invertase Pin-like site-specific DNA recombinase
VARRAPLRVAGDTGCARFISYVRVSTEQQGASGLGLEAQREAIDRHVRGAGGTVVIEFQEIESGKNKSRPEIAKAIAACQTHRATLITAKLDRLARNVAFISNLMESAVEFVACDNPTATRLTIHILAAVAEHEREMISSRTKAALAAAKARGVKLGNPRPKASALAASQAKMRLARQRARDVAPYIEAARAAGCYTLGQLAAALTARGIRTPGGEVLWGGEQVRRILARTRAGPAWDGRDRGGGGLRSQKGKGLRTAWCSRADFFSFDFKIKKRSPRRLLQNTPELDIFRPFY